MLETNEKDRNTQKRNRKSLKKIEDLKKNLIEILELKNILTTMKSSVKGLNSRMEGQGKESVNWNIEP